MNEPTRHSAPLSRSEERISFRSFWTSRQIAGVHHFVHLPLSAESSCQSMRLSPSCRGSSPNSNGHELNWKAVSLFRQPNIPVHYCNPSTGEKQSCGQLSGWLISGPKTVGSPHWTRSNFGAACLSTRVGGAWTGFSPPRGNVVA